MTSLRTPSDGRSDIEHVPGLELFERLDEYSVSVRGSSLRLQYGVEDFPAGLEAQAHYSVHEEAIVVALTEACRRTPWDRLSRVQPVPRY